MTDCQCAPNRAIQIDVVKSECPKMPEGSRLFLDGPIINPEKTKGPVCLSATNAMYPWIIATRFDVFTPDLDFFPEDDCYRIVCPCGSVTFEVRKGAPD